MTDLLMKEFISWDSYSWEPCWSQDTASDLWLLRPVTGAGDWMIWCEPSRMWHLR